MVDATAPRLEDKSAYIPANAVHIRVLNKVDLVKSAQIADGVGLSAKTGEGVTELVGLLTKRAEEGLAGGEPAVITRARHRAELEAAAEALGRFREERGGPEIKAEELRIAGRHLGRLTGRIDVEEVLGAIFSEFCIGK
jgi:tRNA modification GTPase